MMGIGENGENWGELGRIGQNGKMGCPQNGGWVVVGGWWLVVGGYLYEHMNTWGHCHYYHHRHLFLLSFPSCVLASPAVGFRNGLLRLLVSTPLPLNFSSLQEFCEFHTLI